MAHYHHSDTATVDVPRRYAWIVFALTFGLLMVLRLIMQIVRHQETGWLALDQLKKPARERVFPMGLIFGATIRVYLSAATAESFGLI